MNMQPEKLVYDGQPDRQVLRRPGRSPAPCRQIADHIEKFWDPRMRREIGLHIAQGGAGLDPLAKAAIEALRLPKA